MLTVWLPFAGIDTLADVFSTTSTPAEWDSRGDYFFRHRLWAVAAKCYAQVCVCMCVCVFCVEYTSRIYLREKGDLMSFLTVECLSYGPYKREIR